MGEAQSLREAAVRALEKLWLKGAGRAVIYAESYPEESIPATDASWFDIDDPLWQWAIGAKAPARSKVIFDIILR